MTCDELRDELATAGRETPAALATEHLAACARCREVQAALARLDAGFAVLERPDASDELVARTLAAAARGRTAAPPGPEPRPSPWRPVVGRAAGRMLRLGVPLAAAVVLAFFALPSLRSRPPAKQMVGVAEYRAEQSAKPQAVGGQRSQPSTEPPVNAAPADAPVPVQPSLGDVADDRNLRLDLAIADNLEERRARENEQDLDEVGSLREAGADLSGIAGGKADSRLLADQEVAKEKSRDKKTEEVLAEGWLSVPSESTTEEAKHANSKDLVPKLGQERQQEEPAAPPALEDARAFLAEGERTAGLRFQEPRGYWANRYVPGDPEMRLLEARLATLDPAALALATSLGRYRQPFDSPETSALALYLGADRAASSGPTRLRLQVGIQGALRASAIRPPMAVSVVLDLRTHPEAREAMAMRALVEALARARQVGDRFLLAAVGPAGTLLVPPERFQNGPLVVALQQALGGTTPARELLALDLPRALELATTRAARGDDPGAPLGASQVLLVTHAPLGPDLDHLARLAHLGAVAGVATSVVAVGPGVDLAEVDRLVLAGQGNRRLLVEAGEAGALVERELHASSRVVARALRLNLRLAPRVKLIDVLGSRRLDRTETRRVREAEKSIDQRLARSLGIGADRGKDDDGIQIVIPAFQSGDEHVILLDVVVPGPGPVLEVTARYKDLVWLTNGTARAALTLPLAAVSGRPEPLRLNVLKNRLARRVADELRAAADSAEASQAAEAARRLRATGRLLAGLGHSVPGLGGDAELRADARWLEQTAVRLEAGQPSLPDVLRLAAFLKLNRPLPDGGPR